MPGPKEQHQNWIRSHSDETVHILRRGPQFAASFRDRDRLVALIPSLPDGSLVMGEAYRAVMDEISVEFPSRYCPQGDDPKQTATALSKLHSHVEATTPEFMGQVFPSPGLLDMSVHLYSVRLPQPQTGRLIAPEGMLSLKVFSIQEISEAIAKGGMCDAISIACLMRYLTRTKEGAGAMPTRMKEIEILDHQDRVVCTLQTNKPEWGFIQYCRDHPGRAHDWRFKVSSVPTSPTGEPLQVKSSVAMGAKHNAAPDPRPAFNLDQQHADTEPHRAAGDPGIDAPMDHLPFEEHATQGPADTSSQQDSEAPYAFSSARSAPSTPPREIEAPDEAPTWMHDDTNAPPSTGRRLHLGGISESEDQVHRSAEDDDIYGEPSENDVFYIEPSPEAKQTELHFEEQTPGQPRNDADEIPRPAFQGSHHGVFDREPSPNPLVARREPIGPVHADKEGGFTRLAGFLKKAIHRDEDDIFADEFREQMLEKARRDAVAPAPPGPAYRPSTTPGSEP